MELEQDNPVTPDDDPIIPSGEQGDGGNLDISDAPSSEPRSVHDADTSSRDRMLERLHSAEAQARVYQEEAERARREGESLRAAQYQPRETEEQLRERLGPEGYILHQFDQQRREFQNSSLANEVRTSAQIDQLRFDSELDKAQRDLGWSADKRARYSSEIEQFYNNLATQALQSGTRLQVSRIDLLDHKIGREMRTTGGKALKAAADKGKVSIGRQAARMTPAASNVTGKSSGKSKAEESRQRMLEAGVLEM